MKILGITGGTGAGKSTLLGEMSDRGAFVIDCDCVYHELLRDNKEIINEIAHRFEGVVHEGVLHRKALGEIVFSDPEALLDLNAITHKYVDFEIKKLIEDWRKQGGTLVGIDAIALIESGISKQCDIVIGIIAPVALRAQRIIAREGVSMEYALLRIESQQPDSFFQSNCDYILENTYETLDEFKAICRVLLDNIVGGMFNGHER